MTYKIGDKVRVVAQKCGHRFQIGDVVEIVNFDGSDGSFCCSGKSSLDTWWLLPSEIEPITPTTKESAPMTLTPYEPGRDPLTGYVFRDGSPARILCDDAPARCPIRAMDKDGVVSSAFGDGLSPYGSGSSRDLFCAPVTRTVHVAILQCPGDTCVSFSWSSEKRADSDIAGLISEGYRLISRGTITLADGDGL